MRKAIIFVVWIFVIIIAIGCGSGGTMGTNYAPSDDGISDSIPDTSNSGGGGGSGGGSGPQAQYSTENLVFNITDDDDTVEIVISKDTSSSLVRAIISPKPGDHYAVKLNGENVSNGKIAISGRDWTFTPTKADDPSFEAEVDGDTDAGTASLKTKTDIKLRGKHINSGVTIGQIVVIYERGWKVSTLAGSGPTVWEEGHNGGGFANGPGASARFRNPQGVAIDTVGNVYVADETGRIRIITPSGMVSTFAKGHDTVGYPILPDEPVYSPRFGSSNDVALDAAGNLYSSEYTVIAKLDTSGIVSIIAGDHTPPYRGYVDGPAAFAKFDISSGVAIDTAGNVYVADLFNHCIRKISPSGIVSTFAGNGTAGYADGQGTFAMFDHPAGVAVDVAGNVYVADSNNNRIRKINPSGRVSTLAGTVYSTDIYPFGGYADGPAASARFYHPTGVAVDAAGNVYVVDSTNHRIRKISTSGMVYTIAGSGLSPFNWGIGGYADGPGASAKFCLPRSLTLDAAGNIYVADTDNHRIRKISKE